MGPKHQNLPRRQRVKFLHIGESASRVSESVCPYSDGNRNKISPGLCFYPQREIGISFDRRYFELSGKTKIITCFIDSMIYFLFSFF